MYGRPWRHVDTIVSTVATVIMVSLAVASPAMTSADLYAYVREALLGPSAAYSPPSTLLPAEFVQIHRMWRMPLFPAAYGPLWLWWNSAIVGLVAGLHAKLTLLRLVNVLALALTLGALRVLRISPCLLAATAVNPAIAFYYVCNGHNDLIVIVLILFATAFASRSPLGAGIVAGIGASIRSTLFVPAAAVALAVTALPRWLAFVAAMLVTAATIGLGLGGKPYYHAMLVVSAHDSGANRFLPVSIPHFIIALGTVALTVVAVLTRRISKTATFGSAALAQAFFPWCSIWGLPHAAARSERLAALLVGFPIITAVLDNDRSQLIGPLIVVALLMTIGAVLGDRVKLFRTPLKV